MKRSRTFRVTFWILTACAFLAGVALLIFVPSQRAPGALVTGMAALIVLKHVGLFLAFGSPLAALVEGVRRRVGAIFRRRGGSGS